MMQSSETALSVHIDVLPDVNLNDYLLGRLEKGDFLINNFCYFQYAVCLLVLTSPKIVLKHWAALGVMLKFL